MGGGWASVALAAGALAVGVRPRLAPGWRVGRPSGETSAVVAALALLLLAVGLTALAAPPNGSDALGYNLPRVIHWIRNGSVEHYPTNLLRQLNLSPGAEFILLHLQILSGGDRFANLVQWGSLVGCAVAASLVAAELGAGRPGQLLAAVASATVPIAVLEASGTGNDVVVSFWLLVLAYFTVRSVRDGPSWGRALGLGGALGLALLTKGTAAFFALPLCVWLLGPAIGLLRRGELGSLLPLLAVPVLVAALNLGYLARNLELFGDPSGRAAVMRNEDLAPAGLVSLVVRNLALQLAGPWPASNELVTAGVVWLHERIGRAPADPRSTFLVNSFLLRPTRLAEQVASNPLHLLLSLTAVGLLARRPGTVRTAAGQYALLVLVGLLLFTGLLKWQLANARLVLPFFLLLGPIVGLAFGSHRGPWLGLAGALLLAAAPAALWHEQRPLLGAGSVLVTPREAQYLAGETGGQLGPAFQAARALAEADDCRQVGLVAAIDFPEYAAWVSLNGGRPDGIWLEHVLVENASAARQDRPPYREFRPCLLVSGLRMGVRQLFIALAVQRFGSLDDVVRECRERYAALFSCGLVQFTERDPERFNWRGARYRQVEQVGPLTIYRLEARS